MHPLETFTIKALIVAAIVVASLGIFGPQTAHVLAVAWYEGEAAFLAASYQKVSPSTPAASAESAAIGLMLKR